MIEKLITLHEGFRSKVYKCPADKWTVGIGRNLEDLGITEAEAHFLLANDIKRVRAELDRALPWWTTLSPVRSAVLVDMAFNMGIKRLLGFKKMLAALEARDYPETAKQMGDSKWFHDVGKRADRLITMMLTNEWPEDIAT